MIRRIDPMVSRAAYGALCIAGMSALAIPVLAAVGAVVGIVYALDGEVGRALAIWLLSWAAALFAGLLFLGISYTAWPLASDWIMEWPGYATGFAIAGVGLALMALMVFMSPAPLYAAVIVSLAATFVGGFGIAGWLPGVRAGAGRPRNRPRLARRR